MMKWKVLLTFFVYFWTRTFAAEISLLYEWKDTEYDTVNKFVTNTYTACVLSCQEAPSCEFPGLRFATNGDKTCYLLKGKPTEEMKQKTGIQNTHSDGVILKEVILLIGILVFWSLIYINKSRFARPDMYFGQNRLFHPKKYFIIKY